MFPVAKQQNILIDHVELHGRYDRREKRVLLVTQIRGGEKNPGEK
jgi:hypothetical protein